MTTENKTSQGDENLRSSDVLDRVVEAAPVSAPQTADFFVLMVRYGHDYWAAHSTHRDIATAARQADSVDIKNGHKEWRIVAVRRLPVHVAPGELDILKNMVYNL